jgi:hypothetical protein
MITNGAVLVETAYSIGFFVIHLGRKLTCQMPTDDRLQGHTVTHNAE